MDIPISDKKKEEFIEEAIENIFAVLSEADIEFRKEFASSLKTILTSWTEEVVEGQVVHRRYNCLGELCATQSQDLEVTDRWLTEQGYTCLE